MNAVSKSPNTAPIREFNVSNHLLGDRAALEAAWERDGYWFFRNVLDLGAVGRLRAEYMKVLNELGVIEPGCTDAAIYNGANLDDYPITQIKNDRDPLLALYPMKGFVAEPAIRNFFKQLLGDEPVWIPNTEFHAVPPAKDRSSSRFNFIHCDGANNRGLKLKICWIPLAFIDEEIGGLVLAEGLHRPRPNDFARPVRGIPEGIVPTDAWRRTTYRPGDLLVFDLNTPHSGLANYSDRYFRLSMDVRVVKASDHVPFVGQITAVDSNTVTVAADDGSRETFLIDEFTFCRDWDGIPMPLAEIPQRLKIGNSVYVASEEHRATFIRPQH